MTQIDLNRISEILRMLQPRQEKVIRLYFGLGCLRCHSALEIAEAFEVASQVIAGILGAGIQSGPPLEQRRSSGGKARWLLPKPSDAHLRNHGGSLWRCNAELPTPASSGKESLKHQVTSKAVGIKTDA